MNSLQILIPFQLHLKNTTRVPLISCGWYCVLHLNKIFPVDILQFSVVALVEALSTGQQGKSTVGVISEFYNLQQNLHISLGLFY